VEAYPKQSAHISTHLAFLLRETDRPARPSERSSSLKNLLGQDTVTKGEHDGAPPFPSTPRAGNPLKDIMQLLSGLQQHASKKETALSATESGGRDESGIRSAHAAAEKISVTEGVSESLDIVHAETTRSGESLTQKIVDAKATLRHFAQRLHEQVETYKPPFSRMQLSLDPKELGSVEVTLISRGSNLHIQVHSNPTAIGIMAMQGQELKNQLVSMGFTDVQMQFNMNQQQQQKNQHAKTGSRYVEAEETPDFYESLDLIIPQYV
jgi:DNA polymerase III alpha subunit (gram-positive type)